MNIYQRINEARKKVSYARKDKVVQGQGYMAVTHDAVTAILRNQLIEHGIVIIPNLTDSSVECIGQTQKGAPIIRYAAKYAIDFVNVDDPADRFTINNEAHANDHGDKAPGKATSYATKYAMLKVFSIETGEDDEGRVEPYAATIPITEEQAAALSALIAETGSDEGKFLAYFGAESVAALPSARYESAVKMLDAKMKAAS
jgi:hypothetical protein